MQSFDSVVRLVASMLLIGVMTAQLGCAGAGGSGAPAPGIDPFDSTVAINSTTTFEASYLGVESVDWLVREGAAGGTLDPFTSQNRFFATYTAPSAPGVFHIDVTFHHLNGGTTDFSTTVTVQ